MSDSNPKLVLVNLSTAARLLGYISTEPIKKLIAEGHLTTHSLPDSKRVMINRKELESLITPIDLENEEKPGSSS